MSSRPKKPVNNFDAPDFDGHVTRIAHDTLVPEATSDPNRVATWVQNPKVMLQALTKQFRDILKLCDDGELKSTYIYDVNGTHVRVVVESLWLQHYEKCVALVNPIHPTPFDSQIILRVRTELPRGTSSRFRKALKNYRVALHQLEVWIASKDLLSGKPNSVLIDVKAIPSDLPSGTIFSDAGKTPTICIDDPNEERPLSRTWSAFREPREWLRLRKLKGLSNSKNVWSSLVKKHPHDIDAESTKSARITLERAQDRGLQLPEFRDTATPKSL